MFGFKFNQSLKQTLACCLEESSYSISLVDANNRVVIHKHRDFSEKSSLNTLNEALTKDIEHLGLIGLSCRLILTSNQYELLHMDALDVPDEEAPKALRWRLKGLVDYPLNDVAIDVFHIPPHGVAGGRKKIFVAVTPLSALKIKLSTLEMAYLNTDVVTISELALRNFLTFVPLKHEAPVIVIGFQQKSCQLLLFFKNDLYLIRELSLNKKQVEENAPEAQSILLEIQRSMDYCQSELKLPGPRQIYLTPSFHKAGELLQFLRDELSVDVVLIDMNDYLEIEPKLDLESQHNAFYSISGALTPPENEDDEVEEA